MTLRKTDWDRQSEYVRTRVPAHVKKLIGDLPETESEILRAALYEYLYPEQEPDPSDV